MTKPARAANNFDFLRLALSVLVIYSHSFPLGTGSEWNEPLNRWTHGQMTAGAVAVDIFFIMSGYLITASAVRSRGVGDFMIKRVRRIYPAFLVSALLMAVVVMPLAGGHLRVSGAAGVWASVKQSLRLLEFRYVHAFSSNPYPGSINGSVWSISYEFWCYIGIAILSVVGLLKRRWLLLACFVGAWAAGIVFQARHIVMGGKWLGDIVGVPQFWARLLPFYLGGTVFYLFRERIRWNGWAALACLAALVPASVFPLGWVVMFPLVGPYLAFYAAFHPVPVLKDAGRFGDFSYGTYLYAFPVQQLLMQALGHPVAPWELFAMATPLTLLLAAGSWYGVERHWLAPKRRKETVVHAIEVEAQRHHKQEKQPAAV